MYIELRVVLCVTFKLKVYVSPDFTTLGEISALKYGITRTLSVTEPREVEVSASEQVMSHVPVPTLTLAVMLNRRRVPLESIAEAVLFVNVTLAGGEAIDAVHAVLVLHSAAVIVHPVGAVTTTSVILCATVVFDVKLN
jgi:hypothetical protein